MQFTKREEIDLWSGSFSLTGISESQLQQAIRHTIHTEGENFLGFKSGLDNSITRTRYPREKYGIPDIASCRRTTQKLVENLGLNGFTELVPHIDPVCRIVMGLREGYDSDAIAHTTDEVRRILSPYGGEVQEGEVYSLLQGKEPYTEPAAIISINTANIRAVYDLAARFSQERFCVEDAKRMKAFIVETILASSPDSSVEHRD